MLRAMTTFGTMLFTRLRGRPVGADHFGNRYYEQRRPPRTGRTRRWVIYAARARGDSVAWTRGSVGGDAGALEEAAPDAS